MCNNAIAETRRYQLLPTRRFSPGLEKLREDLVEESLYQTRRQFS